MYIIVVSVVAFFDFSYNYVGVCEGVVKGSLMLRATGTES
jgi:hypothetical protein